MGFGSCYTFLQEYAQTSVRRKVYERVPWLRLNFSKMFDPQSCTCKPTRIHVFAIGAFALELAHVQTIIENLASQLELWFKNQSHPLKKLEKNIENK